MPKKRYSITLLLVGKTKDSNYTWMDYQEAFTRSGDALRDHPDAWGVLVHSDQQTGIVLTRKHFPYLKLIKP